jgi:ferredoxin
MKVKVDFKLCEKAGECYYNHPRIFTRNENGYPTIAVREIDDEDLLMEAREAIQVCPAQAISLQE